MSVSSWHRTDGFTEPDPKYIKKKKRIRRTKAKMEEMKVKSKNNDSITLKLEIKLSHNSKTTTLSEIENFLIMEALKEFGNQIKAAKALGISARTIRNKINSLKHPTSSEA